MRATAAILAAAMGVAAGQASALDFDLSTRAAAWSSSLSLDDAEDLTSTQVWLRAKDDLPWTDAGIHLVGEGWINQETGAVEDHLTHKVRQAYAQTDFGPLDVRAGWQIFPWGRADGINPTDNLTPRQLTFLTRDLEDQRFGTPALSMTWFADPVSVNLVWLAGFKPSLLPWPSAAPPVRDIRPGDPADQWAIKFDTVRDDYEGSLSYFDGYDVLPSAAFLSASAPTEIFLTHDRMRVLGGDFAAPVGRFVVRGEIAHTDTTMPEGGAVFSYRPQTYAVAGGEHTFGEYLNVNIQYYYRRVDGSAVPDGQSPQAEAIGEEFAVTAQQSDRTDHGFTFRISDQWLHETLEASVSGVFSTSREGYIVKPLIKYRASDELTVSLGADIFGGSDKTLYGFLKENSTTYLEFRWGY